MIEDDGTIHVACKVKKSEEGALEATTICGNLGAFNGLYQKAKQISEEG